MCVVTLTFRVAQIQRHPASSYCGHRDRRSYRNDTRCTTPQIAVLHVSASSKAYGFASGSGDAGSPTQVLCWQLTHILVPVPVIGLLLAPYLKRQRHTGDASMLYQQGQIDPGEIKICKRPDGSEWLLGAGSFGKVRFSCRGLPA